MNPRDYEIFLLALCAWREARGEPEEGLLAVMHAIRNRVVFWHKSWFDVITGLNQFSSMGTAGDSQTVKWPMPGDPVFGKIQSLAAVVFNDADEDITFGAVYYWNPATAHSGWFEKNVRDKKTWVARIGHHDFYSDHDRAA